MAGSFCDYLENKLLGEAFGATDFEAPVSLYIGLSTTTPTDAGGNITEPTDASYDRVEVDNDTTTFPAPTTGSIANGIAVVFPTFTTASALVTYWFVSDASTCGNIFCYGSLTNPKTVYIGDTASFAIGDLVCTLD